MKSKSQITRRGRAVAVAEFAALLAALTVIGALLASNSIRASVVAVSESITRDIVFFVAADKANAGLTDSAAVPENHDVPNPATAALSSLTTLPDGCSIAPLPAATEDVEAPRPILPAALPAAPAAPRRIAPAAAPPETSAPPLAALTPAAVQATINGYLPRVRFCFAQNPEAKGVVALKFAVNPDGSASNVAIANSTIGNADIEQCLVRRVSVMRFPRFAGDAKNVTFPFRLE